MQPAIPRDEIMFHPHSFGDPAGRLFRWNGELYRGITAEHAPFYTRLFNDGVMQNLGERGLFPESEITNFAVDGFAMVVHHRTIPFPSYPNEWCGAMFKDASLFMLQLALELVEHGLILKDHHLWNITFEACRPVYVDLTSIVSRRHDACWPDYDKFCRYCLYPLLLIAAGHERIARHLMPDYEGAQRKETELLTGNTPRSLRRLVRYRPKHSSSQTDYLKELRGVIEQIELSAKAAHKTEPSVVLAKILSELRPRSLLDLGGGGAITGVNTVSFNADSARAAQRYQEAREGRLPLLPLVMDFTKPTPSIGFGGHYSMAASERFQCEMVFAPANALQAMRNRSLNFDQIAEGLALFTSRWLVVEDPGILSDALRKRFRRMELSHDTAVAVWEK
jgi:hypothetical protein